MLILIPAILEQSINNKMVTYLPYAGDIPRTHVGPIIEKCILLIILSNLRDAGDIPRTHVYYYIVLIIGVI